MIHPLLCAEAIVIAITAFGWVYHLSSWWCVRRRFAGAGQSPPDPASQPPVSILKPLKGVDPELLENLESFCRQDYPRYEILFGSRDADDPAVAVVRQLQQRHPELPLRLAVGGGEGMNPKAAVLDHLVHHARYPLLVISDSDIRVRPDYLRRVTAPLNCAATGAVTCLYTAESTRSCAAEILDALHVNLRFLPAVALAARLPGVRLGFGATLALRREDLMRFGGYRAIADYLADDSMICALFERRGLKVELTDFTVEHRGSEQSLHALWQREVRWVRTSRAIGPAAFAGVILSFPVFWSLVLLACTGGAAWGWAVVGLTVALRSLTAWDIAGVIRTPQLRRYLHWLPLRDVADVLVWASAFTGSRVVWRGANYRLLGDGRLAHDTEGHVKPARRIILRLDGFLRARQHIFEYSDKPSCLFRVNICRAHHTTHLQDGTSIARGERYLELHLWNEHLPEMSRHGSTDLAWGEAAGRSAADSLASLAAYLLSQPALRDIRALHARTAFVTRSPEQLARLVRRLGFEFHGLAPAGGPLGRLHRFGENLLVWALGWAFNPLDRKRRVVARPRHELWMSKQRLVDRYTAPAKASHTRDHGRTSERAGTRHPDQDVRQTRPPSPHRPGHARTPSHP